jgi:ketosteroid isomerase-like protein
MTAATAQDFQQTNRVFETEVVANGNIEALDRVYTTAATILPPGSEAVSGRENIKQFWRGAIAAMNVSAVRLETVSLETTGDLAYEIGRATLEFAASGAAPATAKYVVIWKREDGAWKWHVDIWNPNS